MSELIKTACGVCGRLIEYNPAQAGELATCLACGTVVELAFPRPAPATSLEKSQSLKTRKLTRLVAIIFSALVLVGMVAYLFSQLGQKALEVAGMAMGQTIAMILLIVFALWTVAWLLFPVFVYVELRRANRTLEEIEKNTRHRV